MISVATGDTAHHQDTIVWRFPDCMLTVYLVTSFDQLMAKCNQIKTHVFSRLCFWFPDFTTNSSLDTLNLLRGDTIIHSGSSAIPTSTIISLLQ